MKKTDSSAYERIIAAAAKLFAVQGFDKTTTREIVAEAGSSLSAIQNHFQSKELLYKTVLERAAETFFKINESALDEIDTAEEQGILKGEVAWDKIAQLVGEIVDWAFNDDYFYEIRLINMEYLNMSTEPRYPSSVVRLYETLEKLFESYTGRKNEQWMRLLSFSTVSSAFDCANYRNVLQTLTGGDMSSPETRNRVKAFQKNYLLNSLRANLNLYKAE